MQWDDRLISRADALEIGGEHPVSWAVEQAGDSLVSFVLVLRCQSCTRSCGVWKPGQPTDVNDVLAGVLRHLVMAHDVPLNKPARGRMTTDERNPDSSGDGRGPRHGQDPVGRPGHNRARAPGMDEHPPEPRA